MISKLDRIDRLYDSLNSDQKERISLQEFRDGIVYLEMHKLNDLSMFKPEPFSEAEIRDIIQNKLKPSYNNITPGPGDRCMYYYCCNTDVKASLLPKESGSL